MDALTKNITKGENVGNLPYVKMTEVILVYFNAVNNSYWSNSKILHSFVPLKSFSQLLELS